MSLKPQKGPQQVDTNITGVKSVWLFNNAWKSLLKGAHPVTVNRWYKFGALISIRTVAPSFQEISELPDWVCNAVQESWHNNPHLK
ncbi:hypothetical protein ACS0TY_010461 [Phlomoides rotata]